MALQELAFSPSGNAHSLGRDVEFTTDLRSVDSGETAEALISRERRHERVRPMRKVLNGNNHCCRSYETAKPLLGCLIRRTGIND